MKDRAKLLVGHFQVLRRMAFRDQHDGRELGDEPYITYVCRRLAEVKDDGARCGR